MQTSSQYSKKVTSSLLPVVEMRFKSYRVALMVKKYLSLKAMKLYKKIDS